jgi:hypothetical protein
MTAFLRRELPLPASITLVMEAKKIQQGIMIDIRIPAAP